MTRAKYVVMVSGLALLLSSCRKPVLDMHFVTPFDWQGLTPGVIPVKVWATGGTQITRALLYADKVLVDSDLVADSDTWRFTWDASLVSPGTNHELRTIVSMSLGDGFDEINVRIDTGGPWLRMLSPNDGDSLERGLVPITARARDSAGGGMDRVEFYIDDVLGGTDSAAAGDTYRWTWNDSQATAGGHSLKAKAYNQHGDVAVDGVTVFVKGGTHGGPIYHRGTISADETWSPDNNPHYIDGDVFITNNATVTIMPGCTVRFRSQYCIRAGLAPPLQGGINAAGSEDAPILFTSASASPQPGDWTAIYLDPGTSPITQFSYCTFEYGGVYAGEGEIIIRENQAASFDHCTIRHSRYLGIHCQGAGFRSFYDNTITANGTYPIAVTPDLVPTITPDNDLSGNTKRGILMLAGSVKKDVTWPALGLPYIIPNQIIIDDPTNYPVLSIAAKCSLRFNGGSLCAWDGDIVADGSDGDIVFTADGDPPDWGKFYGIRIGTGRPGDTLSGSLFRSCRMEYGGDSLSGYSGNLQVIRTRPDIKECNFAYGCHWGVVLLGNQVPDTAELRNNNVFAENDSGDIYWGPYKSGQELPLRPAGTDGASH
jgi:hypothetical protein